MSSITVRVHFPKGEQHLMEFLVLPREGERVKFPHKAHLCDLVEPGEYQVRHISHVPHFRGQSGGIDLHLSQLSAYA